MRNLLCVCIMLFASCVNNGADDHTDSALKDSVIVMNDSSFPRPVSKLTDTISVAATPGLVRQDSATIAEMMEKYAIHQWQIMDTMTGDLNRDKFMDMLIVLKHEFDKDDDTAHVRPLIILTGNPDGTLSLAERNDNVVFCYNCGGVFGDPYDGLAIKNGYFSVEHYGGSSTKWTQIITFKYNEQKKTWYLHRDAGEVYRFADTGYEVTPHVYNKEDWGKVRFLDYDYGE